MDSIGKNKNYNIKIYDEMNLYYSAKGNNTSCVSPNNNNWSQEWHLKGREFVFEGGDIKDFENKFKQGKYSISKLQYDAFMRGVATATKSYNIGISNAKEWKDNNRTLEDYYEFIKSNKENPDKCYLKGFEDYFNNLLKNKNRI